MAPLLNASRFTMHIAYWTQAYRGHDLDLSTLRVMWRFDIPSAMSCRCSIATESESPAYFELMGHKHFEVTTFTFQGHMTSSITWPFGSPCAVSCWCSIGTESIPTTVFEIFVPKNQCTHTHRTLYIFGKYAKCQITVFMLLELPVQPIWPPQITLLKFL